MKTQFSLKQINKTRLRVIQAITLSIALLLMVFSISVNSPSTIATDGTISCTGTTDTTASITLNITSAPGGETSQIYRIGPTTVATGATVNGVGSTSFTDTGLTPGTTYTYSFYYFDGTFWVGPAMGPGEQDSCTTTIPAVPDIDVEKFVEETASAGTLTEAAGTDTQDSAPGLATTVGTPLTFTYIIRNTGTDDLNNITLTDTDLGTITGSCPATTLTIGSSMTCTVTDTAVYHHTTEANYSNTATVQGTGVISTTTDSDTDDAYYTVPVFNPDIDVEKVVEQTGSSTITETAVTGTVQDVVGDAYLTTTGTNLTWSYFVTNTGDEPLVSVAVTDSVSGVNPSCPQATLAPAATMTCTATGVAGSYPTGSEYNNIGTVSADGQYTSTNVGDTDQSWYTTTATPQIDVEKFVEETASAGTLTEAAGADTQDSAPGLATTVGTPITFTYIIRNTGTDDLNNITLTDTDLGTVTGSCPATTLTIGSSMTCTATDTAIYHHLTEANYSNTATVQGTGVISTTTDSDTDDAHYTVPVFNPDVDVEKVVEETGSSTISEAVGATVQDDTGDAYVTTTGTNLTWSYFVTNTGDEPLVNVAVTDSVSGVNPSCPQGTLAPAATMTCTATGVAGEADYNNEGTVTADGQHTGSTVSDSDFSYYEIVRADILLKKYVDDQSGDEDDAQKESESVVLLDGDDAVYTIRITTGDGLEDLDIGGTDASTNNLTDTTCSSLSYVSGDTDTDSILDTDEAWEYACTISAISTSSYNNSGDTALVNTASVTGNPVTEAGADISILSDVSDDDPAYVVVSTPSIDLKKYVVVDGDLVDADTESDSVQFTAGETVEFEIHVTNTGNTYLLFDEDDFTLSCEGLSRIDAGDEDSLDLLAPDETWRYRCSSDDIDELSECVALVDAQPTDKLGVVLGATTVQDDDPVNVEPTVTLAATGLGLSSLLYVGTALAAAPLAAVALTRRRKIYSLSRVSAIADGASMHAIATEKSTKSGCNLNKFKK
ncbi:MAG: hypothetical protein AAF413_01095 [Patescibacteria group bacterium]